MRVFISSVIGGMEDYRNAVAHAISTLGYDTVRAENFNASPESPRIACLEGVRSSDALILIVGERYGEPQESGLSATHEEYKEAREFYRPVIVMVQKNVTREERQKKFLEDIRDWHDGHYTASFCTCEELFGKTISSLHQLALQRAAGSVDSDEILQQALSQLSQRNQLEFYEKVIHHGSLQEKGYFFQRYVPQSPYLALTLACGPRRVVLRPAQMESMDLRKRLLKTALDEPVSLFSLREGTDSEVDNDVLVLMQKNRIVRLTENGSISYLVVLQSPGRMMPTIIEEDVVEQIDRFTMFSNDVLNYIDDSHRLSHCVIAALLLNADYTDWRTRSFHEKNSDSMQMSRVMAPPMQTVTLSPSLRPRAELRSPRSQLVEDLTIQLRREFFAN